MSTKIIKIFSFAILLLLCYHCNKQDILYSNEYTNDSLVLVKYFNLPDKPYEYRLIDLPSFYNNQFIRIQDNTPDSNLVTNWGATLGRVLFYDKSLSKNNTIACASCHQQKHGFSDSAVTSLGFLGGRTNRHSMGLANANYYTNKKFFWDERAASLEDQVLMPIQDAVEMGMNLDSLRVKLNKLPYYSVLFKRAYGDTVISNARISKALAQFVRSMVSYRSKYDMGRKEVNHDTFSFPNFSILENDGKNIFFKSRKLPCAVCHFTSTFTIDVPRNNGVFSDDKGSMNTTNDPMDYGKFKVPSLKNIAIRPPYMHNGIFKSIDEVIDHYSNGFYNLKNLDPHMYIGKDPIQYNFSVYEHDALKAFLNTLTDEPLLNDEKFSNPFK